MEDVPLWRLNHFFLAWSEKTCFYEHTNINQIELELWGWSQMIGNLSKIIHLPQNLRKVGYCLTLSLVLDKDSYKKSWDKMIFFQNQMAFQCFTVLKLFCTVIWKFEGFWASSFQATKVYYLPYRFKDGVDNFVVWKVQNTSSSRWRSVLWNFF